MLEPLEDKVKKFAEQSRDRLLEEIRIKKGKDTVEAVWQGFASDGQAQVKYDNETKKVRGLGNANKIRGQKVLVDKAKTAEYEKVTDKPKEPKVKGAEIVRAQVPTREDMLMPLQMPLGGEEEKIWVLAYTSSGRTSGTFNNSASALYTGNTSGSDSSSNSILQDIYTGTYGKKIVVSASAATARATWGSCTASTTSTVTSASASASAPSTGTAVVDYDHDFSITSGSHASGNLTANVSSVASGQAPFPTSGGNVMAGSSIVNITLPNSILYIEWENMPEGTQPIRIDLNSIPADDIIFQRITHLYCRRNSSNNVIAYVTVSVYTADFSDITHTVTTSSTKEDNLYLIGPWRVGVIHLEINLTTRTVLQSKHTDKGPYSTTYPQHVARAFTRNEWASGQYGTTGLGSVTTHFPSVWYLLHIGDVTECYPGDWMYPFRGIVYDATAQAGIDYWSYYRFIANCSYDYETESYNFGLNSIAPPFDLIGRGPDFDWRFGISTWTPPDTSGWYGNTPNYGNYIDLNLLDQVIRTDITSEHSEYEGFININAAWTNPYLDKRGAPFEPTSTEVNFGSNSQGGLYGDDISEEFFISLTYQP